MNELNNNDLIGITALLIHAAKIDENYTDKEKKLILDFVKSHIKNEDKVNEILDKADKLESNSNQLLSFTNLIKKYSLEFKKIIIKELWKIIISDSKTDMYESNIMRRICGLIYFPDKLSGEIKLSLNKENK
jgi:uncharacterized tellurite resistance protein B-like protein